jgi:hypothetical protein
LGIFHTSLLKKLNTQDTKDHKEFFVLFESSCHSCLENQIPQWEQFPLLHDPQDGSDMPETALPPLSAKKIEIFRLVCFPLQTAQGMGASD